MRAREGGPGPLGESGDDLGAGQGRDLLHGRGGGRGLGPGGVTPGPGPIISATLLGRALWAVGLTLENGGVRAPGTPSFATVAIVGGTVTVGLAEGAKGAGDSELHIRGLIAAGMYEEAASSLLSAWARWDLSQRRGLPPGALREVARAAEATFLAQVPGAVSGPGGASAPLAPSPSLARHTVTLGLERWASPGEGLPAGADASLVLLVSPPLPMPRVQAAALVELGGGPAPTPCEARVASPHLASLVHAVATKERVAAGLPAPPASLRPISVELRDPATGALASVAVSASPSTASAPVAASEEIIWVHRIPLFSATRAPAVVQELSRHAAHLLLIATGTRTDPDAARAAALAKLSAQARASLRSGGTGIGGGGRGAATRGGSDADPHIPAPSLEPQATVVLSDPPNRISIHVPGPHSKSAATTLSILPGGHVTVDNENGGGSRPLEHRDLSTLLLDLILHSSATNPNAAAAAATSTADTSTTSTSKKRPLPKDGGLAAKRQKN